MSERSPVSQPSRIRRIVFWLVVVDTVVLVAALGVWMLIRSDDAEENVLNEGLRGSRPPAGQTLPPLDEVAGLLPTVSDSKLRGDAVQLVATCLDCTSGEIIGGYLGRLGTADVPEGARVVLVGWDGDLADWQRRWRVDGDLVELHAARDAATASELRELFGIAPRGDAEESGIAYLYDTRGRWRSTYFLGQLDREDITHDLRVLARD
jgi:hypothetical protein